MKANEVQDLINMYSMIRFSDGHREPGIILNKYNISESCIEYFFIQHNYMNDYKKAYNAADQKTCMMLAMPIDLEEVTSITTINLSDYKSILELHAEYISPPRTSNG